MLCSWADAERVDSPGWQHEDWPPCSRGLVWAQYSSYMQLNLSFRFFFPTIMSQLYFSSDKPVKAAMEKVRRAITRCALLYILIPKYLYSFVVCCFPPHVRLFSYKLVPQFSDWKSALGGAVEQAPDQSIGVGKVFFWSLMYCFNYSFSSVH